MIRIVGMSVLLAFAAEGCVHATDLRRVGLDEPVGAVTAAPNESVDDQEPTVQPGLVDLPRFPSISPDGSWIVFSWRGDLWKVPAIGGHAERMTRHPGDDLRSAWSPDGARIAFDSDRTGSSNIFIMNADGTDLRQVTDTDQHVAVTGFGEDETGREVVTLFGRIEGDVYRALRPYTCSTAGGDIVRLHDAFGFFPRISPDARFVAFTRGTSRWTRRGYRGPNDRDIWLHDRSNDSFNRLTSWEGNDCKACWVDSETLLFLSDRELDCVNVYRMDVKKGGKRAKGLTSFAEDDVQSLDVSADGSTAVFMVWDKLYTLALRDLNAEPRALTITANEDEADNYELKEMDKQVSEAVLSPDGKVMAFTAYGELYIRNIEENSPTRRVTHSHARDNDILWSPDGLKLYFVSDRDGTESIFTATVALTRGEVKEEFEKATKPPEEEEEEEDGEKPAEEEDETEEDPEAGAAEQGDDDASATGVEDEEGDETEASKDEDDEDSDEEDKEEEGKEDEEEEEEDELPKELQPDRWHDALKFNIEPVLQTEHNDCNPMPSLDGKSLALRRGRGDLMIMDLESGEVRTLVTGWDDGLECRWSPDSRHIAYSQNDLDYNADIWVVPADGSQPPVNITRHPDEDFGPRWSADGKILSFISERVNEEFDVWMVYLDKDVEAMTPRELEQYYKDAVEAAKKRKPLKIKKPEAEEEEEEEEGEEDGDEDAPKEEAEADEPGEDAGDGSSETEKADEVDEDEKEDDANEDEGKEEEDEEEEEEEPKELDLADAYLRVRRVTSFSGNEDGNAITPAGDRYIFNATIDTRGLFSVKWDGTDRKRLCGPASVQQVSLTGDKVVLVEGRRGATVGPDGGSVEYVDISDKIRIDLKEQASQKFLEMARVLGEQFYHPTLKGLDWERLTKKYHALACQTCTANEFDHVGMRLLGELNGSHLGVYSHSSPSPNAQRQGRLGTVHKRVDEGFEVVEVVPESPAAKGPMALKVGDVITAVDLEPFGPTDTVESRLVGRVDQETLFGIKRTMDDGEVKELDVLITPIGAGALNSLKYKAWRLRAAELVNERSDSRLGYIHIQGMGQASLDVFERDLYAAAEGKEGLIIDVRDNGGGWTADRLLASIMVQPHAYTLPRGADPDDVGHYPQPRLFIQRYTLPMNMLCNENSFSNAEIVAHAFKTLKRGTLVGQQTYGGVISTGGAALIDGTLFRIPMRGWFLLDGTDMENNGAMPDIVVPQTPEAEVRDEDEQLRAAVDDMLKRLKRDKGPRFGKPVYSR